MSFRKHQVVFFGQFGDLIEKRRADLSVAAIVETFEETGRFSQQRIGELRKDAKAGGKIQDTRAALRRHVVIFDPVDRRSLVDGGSAEEIENRRIGAVEVNVDAALVGFEFDDDDAVFVVRYFDSSRALLHLRAADVRGDIVEALRQGEFIVAAEYQGAVFDRSSELEGLELPPLDLPDPLHP